MMACHDRSEMRVLSQAHAAALAALAGQHRPQDGEALETLTDHLPDCHPMRDAVASFRAVQAKRFPTVQALQDAGRALRHAVTLHLMPQPVGQGRADIHG